jgi:hypothetical protein
MSNPVLSHHHHRRRSRHEPAPRRDEERPAGRRPSSRRRPGFRIDASSGKAASVLCVMAAFLAFGTALIIELVAHTREELPNVFLNALAGLLALAALGAGGYAQTVQLRHWSRRARNRLLVGVPVGALTLAMVVVNFYEKQIPVRGTPPAPAGAARGAEDRAALFRPGWYGQGQENGVLAVVGSFDEGAAESREFNRLVTRSVSYATLTVINQGNALPVVLKSVRVGLLLDSGEEAQSLDVKPLLNAAGTDEGLKRRLSEPKTIASGAMVADIPVCLEPGFRWERVREVEVALGDRVLLVQGRMMTAEEKRALAETPGAAGAPPAAASTNLSAETWFKDL